MPGNGLYRLTRGTYAQWGAPLPHPERATDPATSSGTEGHAVLKSLLERCLAAA